MRTEDWDRETFRKVLAAIQDRTRMSEGDLAELAGRSRSQVNRWTRAENQPTYEPIRRLVDELSKYGPEIKQLGSQLLTAAGYAPPEPAAHISRVRLTAPQPPEVGVQVEQYDDGHLRIGVTVDTDVGMDEAIESLGQLSDNERATVYMLKGMGYSPAEVAGAVLLLRGLDKRRAARNPPSRRKA